LFCPGPSSLNRPHPPHSRAHRDFTAWRLIRDAFAVRERLGDPRVVPSFRCSFFPGMPSPTTPGNPITVSSRTAMSAWPSPRIDRLGIPKDPAIRCTREVNFGATWFTHSLRPAKLLAPLYGSDRQSGRPPGAFTSRLSTGRSPFPLLDITTTATGPPLLAGLSPARMTASFAAPIRYRLKRKSEYVRWAITLLESGRATTVPRHLRK
jgi:hypothetical protein